MTQEDTGNLEASDSSGFLFFFIIKSIPLFHLRINCKTFHRRKKKNFKKKSGFHFQAYLPKRNTV